MNLKFNAKPGSWERHVQRRYQYPELFSQTCPDQATLQAAQAKDEEERQQLREDFVTLVREISSLEATTKTERVLDFKQQIDSLYERSAGLGGDFSREQEALHHLAKLIMQAIRAASDAHDAHAQAELDKETQARTLHFELLQHPIIAHLLRPDSPITQEEIVPALLCEDEVPLQATMTLFTAEQQQILAQVGRQCLERLRNEGQDTLVLWRRLAILERLPH